MEARSVIDRLKNISYAVKLQEEKYFDQGKWHDTDYYSYSILHHNLGVDCEGLLATIKADLDCFNIPSTDKEKETLLHYFLRQYYIHPSTDNYYYHHAGVARTSKGFDSAEAFLKEKNFWGSAAFVERRKVVNRNISTEVLQPLVNEKLTPDQLYKALQFTDAEDNTPLHVGASMPMGSGLMSRLQVVLKSLARLDAAKRNDLLEYRNNRGETLIDCAARNPNPQVFNEICNAFHLNVIQYYIGLPNSQFFKLLASNNSEAILSIINKLEADQVNKLSGDEEKSVNIPLQLSQPADNENRNFLQIACRNSGFGQNNKPLVERVCGLLDDHHEVMLQATARGWTALHYACRSGIQENISQLITTIKSPERLYQALTMQTNRGYTPLHLACEYGDKKTVELLFEKLENLAPGTSYYLIKHHETALRKRVKENKCNPRFNEFEFDALLSKHYHNNKILNDLIETYRYLEIKENEWSLFGAKENYCAKKSDFLSQLRIKTGQDTTNSSFSADARFKTSMSCCFFNKGSQRYYNRMKNLTQEQSKITEDIWNQFEMFLNLQGKSELRDDIIAAVKDRVKPMNEAIPSRNPEAPPVGDDAALGDPPAYSLN